MKSLFVIMRTDLYCKSGVSRYDSNEDFYLTRLGSELQSKFITRRRYCVRCRGETG